MWSVGKWKGCAVSSLNSKPTTCIAKITKELYQIISIIDESVQLIIVYSSKNCPLLHLVQDIKKIIEPNLIPVIAGDFNFDKGEKNALTKFLLISNNFEQLVQLPTHDKGRTIDHCYVPKDKKEKFQLRHHSPYYSDHDALLISYKKD